MPLESAAGSVRTYTYEEIGEHGSCDDLWMILHGKVYDITSVVDSHPGGAEVLFDAVGTDASVAFDEVGHSQDSLDMLRPLLVGVVDDSDDARHYTVPEKGIQVENSSIGESKFSKKLKRRKKKTQRDQTMVYLLGILAIMAALAYICLSMRKRN